MRGAPSSRQRPWTTARADGGLLGASSRDWSHCRCGGSHRGERSSPRRAHGRRKHHADVDHGTYDDRRNNDATDARDLDASTYASHAVAGARDPGDGVAEPAHGTDGAVFGASAWSRSDESDAPGPSAAERSAPGPRAPERSAPGPRAPERSAPGPRAPERSAAGLRAPEPSAAGAGARTGPTADIASTDIISTVANTSAAPDTSALSSPGPRVVRTRWATARVTHAVRFVGDPDDKLNEWPARGRALASL
jgi:hypothetical protein